MSAFVFQFKITGDKECDKVLKDMERKDARKLIKQAVKEGIKIVATSLKSKVHKVSGDWYRSTKVKAYKPNRKRVGFRLFFDVQKLRNPEEFYPAFNEFGWKNVPPKPIIRQSYEENVEKVAKMMREIILKGFNG